MKGEFWIAVGMGPTGVKTYRLIPIAAFDGEPTTYNEKTAIDSGEAARNDPNGFYHGMRVEHRGKTHVLCGPPAILTAGPEQPQPAQGTLFDL